MANMIYPKAKQAFMSKQIDMTTDTIKVALVSDGYTYSSTHQFYSDLAPTSNVVGSPATLAGVTVTDGVLNGSNPAFTGLSSTATIRALAIYKDTGTASTSPLIAYLDTGTGFPFTLNTNITEVDVNWDTGNSKILSL